MNSVVIALRLIAAGALVGLCAAPILYGYGQVVDQPESLRALLDAGALGRLARSCMCAALVAFFATAAGIPLGLSWAGVRGRAHALLVALSIAPFLLPPYVYALAWIELAGATRIGDGLQPLIGLYSISGVVLIETMRLAPVAAGLVWFAVRFADSAPSEASLLARGARRTLVSVVFPVRAPILLAAPLLVFMLTFSNYSVAALLQVDLYPIDIQNRFSARYDTAGAFALTLPMMLAGAVLAAGWAAFAARFSRKAGAAVREDADPVAFLSEGIVRAVLFGFAGLAVGGPLAVIVSRTSWRAVVEAFRGLASETSLSIGVSVACAALATLLAVSVAAAFGRRGWAVAVASLPLFVTGPAFGIGAILLWNHADWRGAYYDSAAVLVFTGTGRVIVFGVIAAAAGFAMQPRDLAYAAELAGHSWVSRLLNIGVPLAAPALVFAAPLMFLSAFAEADTAAIIAPPGATPLAVRIAGLLHYGPSDYIHAASLLSVAVMVLTIVVAGLAVRWMAVRTT